MTSPRRIATIVAGLLHAACAACGSSGTSAPGPIETGDAGTQALPIFTDEERALLATLSPVSATELPPPPPDVSNAHADDPRAAALGQKLFFDPGFSGRLLDGDNDGSTHALGRRGETGKVACAGCHLPEHDFLDARTLGQSISLGSGWGRRRAPSLLDVGQAKLLMWDGRHDALYNQPFGPLESPVEMNSSRLFVAEQLHARYRDELEAIFGAMPPMDDHARFPVVSADVTGCSPAGVDTKVACDGALHGMPLDHAEFDALSPADQDAVTRVVVDFGKSIAAYERKLTCGAGRFDAFVHGKPDALSASEQRGAALFLRNGCATCHSGAFFSDQRFHDVGLAPKLVAVTFLDADDEGASAGLVAALADPLSTKGKFSDGDDGRLSVASSSAGSLRGAFRTPTLRCVSRRPTFMHTGQIDALEDVVSFFARGGDPAGFLGKNELHALALGADEQRDLLAFLRALDGPGAAVSLRAP